MRFLSTTIAGLSCLASSGLASSNTRTAGLKARRAVGQSLDETIAAAGEQVGAITKSDDNNIIFRNVTEIAEDLSGNVLLLITDSKKDEKASGKRHDDHDEDEESEGEAEETEDNKDSGDNSETHDHAAKLVCKTCFIRANATASLHLDKDFNMKVFDDLTGEFTDLVGDMADNTTKYAKTLLEDLSKDDLDSVSIDNLDLPPLELDLNVDISELRGMRLKFGFRDLEVYMEVDMELQKDIPYSLNLLESTEAVGFGAGDDLDTSVTTTMDLIITADDTTKLTTGFHFKLEDGFFVDLNMFADFLQTVDHKGAKFEFLPVTIDSGDVNLHAVLRMGFFAGIKLKTSGLSFDKLDIDIPAASGGLEVGVFADLVDFKSHITQGDQECSVYAQDEYGIALAVAPGVAMQLGNQTWGPEPRQEIPIYTTTLSKTCADADAASTGAADALERRHHTSEENDFSTVTSTTTKVRTFTECEETSVVACPASKQSIHKSTVTEEIPVAMRSGTPVPYSEMPENMLRGFGPKAHTVAETSGEPKTHQPAETGDADKNKSTGEGEEEKEEEEEGPDNPLIIGVSLGIGGPLLLALIGGITYYVRRRRNRTKAGTAVNYASVPRGHDYHMMSEPYEPDEFGLIKHAAMHGVTPMPMERAYGS